MMGVAVWLTPTLAAVVFLIVRPSGSSSSSASRQFRHPVPKQPEEGEAAASVLRCHTTPQGRHVNVLGEPLPRTNVQQPKQCGRSGR